MNKKACNSMVAALTASLLTLGNAVGAFAAAMEPFFCGNASGSLVAWTSVQGHKCIAATLRHSGDMGGGKFEQLSGVKGNSVITVIPITNTTSSNLLVQLSCLTNSGQILFVNPTSTAGGTYTWNLAQYGLTSSHTITKMSIFARNSTGNPGTIYFHHFAINNAQVTGEITSLSGCLSY
ncbi:MAG TPA: hypothetical protein V6C81_24800 [Planktothrix sp.]|jgi:hypothetical protein